VRELADQIGGGDPSAVVFFCSAAYDLRELEAQLGDRFADANVFGCTTAGELALDGYAKGALVGMSFPRSEFTTALEHFDDLGAASLVQICEKVRSLVLRLHILAPAMDETNTFALLLIDGLAGIEETALSAIVRELGNIALVGGSAGDNLAFHETNVYADGAFRAGRAVLCLLHTARPFEAFRTQHITSLDTKMVVTEADPARRVVTEINAEPAAAEYARLSGIAGQELDEIVLATHPVCVRVGGSDYVRSIRSVNEDQSLTFYCAIDEGIVLSPGVSTDIVADLNRLFDRLRGTLGAPSAVLGFDCIFRRIELQHRNLTDLVSTILAANKVVGFSTYGEQFKAMHLNQTFSGVAFGADAARR
jgi:hypothetical protein